MNRLLAIAEVALLQTPLKAPFFRDVIITRVAATGKIDKRILAAWSGIPKAQLVEPPMEEPSANFDEIFSLRIRQEAGNQAWMEFTRRVRSRVEVGVCAEDPAFWREINPLVAQVGPEPILIISPMKGRALRRFGYGQSMDLPGFRVERRTVSTPGASYIATIGGVDAFECVGLPPGTALLFSGKILQRVALAADLGSHRLVHLSFELGDELNGTLKATYWPNYEWAGTQIFELHTVMPDE